MLESFAAISLVVLAVHFSVFLARPPRRISARSFGTAVLLATYCYIASCYIAIELSNLQIIPLVYGERVEPFFTLATPLGVTALGVAAQLAWRSPVAPVSSIMFCIIMAVVVSLKDSVHADFQEFCCYFIFRFNLCSDLGVNGWEKFWYSSWSTVVIPTALLSAALLVGSGAERQRRAGSGLGGS